MTTRSYLKQLTNIDRRIKDKIEEAQRWFDIATDRSVRQKEINVQTSGSKDRMGDAVAYSIDCRNEADELAMQLARLKHTIISQIDGMEDDNHYNILKSFYIRGKSLTEISVEEHYSYKQVKRYFEQSLKEFEKRYGSTYLTA